MLRSSDKQLLLFAYEKYSCKTSDPRIVGVYYPLPKRGRSSRPARINNYCIFDCVTCDSHIYRLCQWLLCGRKSGSSAAASCLLEIGAQLGYRGKSPLTTVADTPTVFAKTNGKKITTLAVILTSNSNEMIVSRQERGITSPTEAATKMHLLTENQRINMSNTI